MKLIELIQRGMIQMSEIIMDIIANITGFITYFVPGYIFISCFNYTACLQRETEQEYLIMKSISISYIIYVLTSYVGTVFSINIFVIQMATFIVAILLGLVFGRIHRVPWANEVSLLLFKREMANNLFVELWEKANDNNAVICATLTMKDNLGIYEGQIYKVSSYNNNPEILLAYYICYDCNMNIISDYSSIDNANLVVRFSDIQRFEFELITVSL